MRYGFIFLAMALVFVGFAFQGVTTESVRSFGRYGRDVILLDADPTRFSILLLFHILGAGMFCGLAVFFFWSARATKVAEDRYFRQKDLLAPKKD